MPDLCIAAGVDRIDSEGLERVRNPRGARVGVRRHHPVAVGGIGAEPGNDRADVLRAHVRAERISAGRGAESVGEAVGFEVRLGGVLELVCRIAAVRVDRGVQQCPVGVDVADELAVARRGALSLEGAVEAEGVDLAAIGKVRVLRGDPVVIGLSKRQRTRHRRGHGVVAAAGEHGALVAGREFPVGAGGSPFEFAVFGRHPSSIDHRVQDRAIWSRVRGAGGGVWDGDLGLWREDLDATPAVTGAYVRDIDLVGLCINGDSLGRWADCGEPR